MSAPPREFGFSNTKKDHTETLASANIPKKDAAQEQPPEQAPKDKKDAKPAGKGRRGKSHRRSKKSVRKARKTRRR